MKSTSTALLVFSVLFSASAGTLVWTGGGDGSKWSDPSNWNGTPDWSAANDLDFTSLANGASLVNDTTTKIASMTFKENAGTIAISSANTLASDSYWTIPPGTTLHAKFNIGKNTSWTWRTVTIAGGGDLKIGGIWVGGYGGDTYVFDNVAVEVASGCEISVLSYNNRVTLRNGATLRITANGSNCGILLSESAADGLIVDADVDFMVKQPRDDFAGSISGAGRISCIAGTEWKVTGDLSGFSGLLRILNADVTMGAGQRLGRAATVEIAESGVLTLGGNQELAELVGGATCGAVSIPSGAVLSVGKDDLSTGSVRYTARLTGDGGFEKSGTRQLVLSGPNSYKGPTKVTAGRLVIEDDLSHTSYPDGLVARYSFDDNYYEDSVGGNDFGLVSTATAQPVVMRDGTGKVGNYARFTAGDGVNCEMKTKGNDAIDPDGNWSYSAWIRPSAETTANNRYFMNPGNGLFMKWVNGGVSRYFHCGGTSGWLWSTGEEHAGRWNHFCVTQEDGVRKYYWDGRLCETSENNPLGGVPSPGHIDAGFDGDIDEILYFNRALTADEVNGLLGGTLPSPSRTTVAAELPEPVVHWDFNDPDNPGKDVSGNGCDLEVAGGNVEIVEWAGGYGRTLKTISSSGYLKRDGTAGLPARFPKGGESFTVSLRMAPTSFAQGVDVLSFGDVTTPNSFFRVSFADSPGSLGWDVVNPSSDCSVSQKFSPGERMQHVVFSYDRTTGILTSYRDGVKDPAITAEAAPNIAEDGTVYVCYTPSSGKRNSGRIDDIQIFDTALSAEQVRLLVQTLGTDRTLPPTLPEDSPVTVESGASLSFRALGVQKVKSLSGGGDVDLVAGTTLLLGETAAVPFTGSVSPGLTLAEGFTFNLAATDVDEPKLALKKGSVTLPKSAVVSFFDPGTLARISEGVVFTLVTAAGGFTCATDSPEWTIDGLPKSLKAKFSVEENSLKLRIDPYGFIIMYR